MRIEQINWLPYTAMRIYLRLLLGRQWRDRVMEKVWASRYDLPLFLPGSLRQYLHFKFNFRQMMIHCTSKRPDYEPQVSTFVQRLHGKLFVDVGANMGFYTRLLENNFERIVAIEADPFMFKYLKEICPPNCQALNLAAADRDGLAKLGRNPDNLLGGASIMLDKGIEISKTSLSAILSREHVVDLVKVDVEGAEWLVLEGAGDVMPHIKQWVIELHDMKRKVELEEYMREHGYECRWLDEKLPHAYFWRPGH
jgi:FkbM family methyltransferase